MSGEPARGAGHGGPARGYTWPPFEKGNTAAVTYGAHSERIVAPLAERARSELAETAPWIESPAFASAVNAWSRTEARIALVSAWLDEHGELDDDGEPRPAAEQLIRLERLGLDLRARIGLDPTSCARLQRDLAGAARDVDLASLAVQGRRIREERGELDGETDQTDRSEPWDADREPD